MRQGLQRGGRTTGPDGLRGPRRRFALLAVFAVLAAACSAGTGEGQAIPPLVGASLRNQLGYEFPAAPAVPAGPADDALVESIETLLRGLAAGSVAIASLEEIASSNDGRAAWLIADLLRFLGPGKAADTAIAAFESLTAMNIENDPISARSPWQSISDHLIAWDLPALGGYARWKGDLFTIFEPKWEPFFADQDAEIDWRLVSWGGVLLDDRSLGDGLRCPEGCIPAIDDPGVTDAAGGDWYPDDRLVFGVTIGGESRAYPKNIMEIHEVVNDTVGGRRLGIPYCTLCGSAQAYFTDSVPDGVEVPLLRTSGLLVRSNKVMFDLKTFSMFDTFTGVAVSGPLREQHIALEQASVVTSTWGEWKTAHPETTIVAEDGGINRTYSLDPLRGRDDDGPIFPIGDVDDRLPVHQKVVGVVRADGVAIAFPVDVAVAELAAERPVQLMGVVLAGDASGVRAFTENGAQLVSHEAFWFAWSQFHPETLLWAPPADR